jgi:parallel beta-helix repeat protein
VTRFVDSVRAPHPFRLRLAPRLALLLFGLTVLLSVQACSRREFPGYVVVTLAPGADLEYRLRGALIAAKPGTVIELPAGRFDVREELSINVSHVVIRGKGMNETILSFANQETGPQGMGVVANGFVAQDFAIEDAAGDGIKFSGVTGVTVQGVRVEWTNGPATNNGAYGLYPVGCFNVLIENSVVIGASDAGIYVGQSEQIVVRNNRVEYNVAGIEIENSKYADVYLNRATHNTGGILVFDLPNLPKQGGRQTRVFMNYLDLNDTPNFAAAGNTVALVPAGTGVLVFSNDDVEVFRNFMTGNGTMGVGVGSYLLTELFGNKIKDPNYDAYPEKIHVHNNVILNGGLSPAGVIGSVLNAVFDPTPDIALDGYVDAKKLGPGGVLPPELRICIHDNQGTAGAATFGSLGGFPPNPSDDLSPHACTHPPLAAVNMPEPTPPPVVEDPYTPAEIAALCNAQGAGINRAALVVDCPNLSDYRLFPGNDPFATPNEGGIPYDLTTPLFSDYAQKYRVVFLPPGTSATYSDTDVFSFPVGTVIAKTFTFANDLRNLALGERWIETRLLIHRTEGWVGIPYVWADDRSEAVLALGGSAVDVTWIDTDGSARGTNYRVPNVVQCGGCHVGPLGADPIGPKARLLNKSHDYAGTSENQLAHWTAAGVLVGAPAPAAAPRLPVWNDPGDGTLEERARAYLESNCAHCHNPAGRAKFSGLWLEHDRPMGPNTGICKAPVATGAASGGFLYAIKPGHPEQSILVYRMSSALPAIKMPELSKSLVHDEGVDLVTAWIQTMPEGCP